MQILNPADVTTLLAGLSFNQVTTFKMVGVPEVIYTVIKITDTEFIWIIGSTSINNLYGGSGGSGSDAELTYLLAKGDNVFTDPTKTIDLTKGKYDSIEIGGGSYNTVILPTSQKTQLSVLELVYIPAIVTAYNFTGFTNLILCAIINNEVAHTLMSVTGLVNLAKLQAVVLNGLNNTSIDASIAPPNIALSEFDVDSCPSLDSIDLTGRSGLVKVQITNCNLLTQVMIDVTQLIVDFTCTNAALVQDVNGVNNILENLDANGLLNGSCDLSGGSSPTPTLAGLTAKNNLIVKGWTVTTN